MPDKFGKEIRSKIMASIRSKNTKSELLLKEGLRGLRLRYQPKMLGNPDFGSRKRKLAIFVHGCFWHGCPKHYKEPGSRKRYWVPKIERNMSRDKLYRAELKKTGYKVLYFWEHELQNNFERCVEKVLVSLK